MQRRRESSTERFGGWSSWIGARALSGASCDGGSNGCVVRSTSPAALESFFGKAPRYVRCTVCSIGSRPPTLSCCTPGLNATRAVHASSAGAAIRDGGHGSRTVAHEHLQPAHRRFRLSGTPGRQSQRLRDAFDEGTSQTPRKPQPGRLHDPRVGVSDLRRLRGRQRRSRARLSGLFRWSSWPLETRERGMAAAGGLLSPCPRFTCARRYRRMTWGHRGSLVLQCEALSSSCL